MTLAFALPLTHILVPQGAEYQAVKRGLARFAHPQAIAIPLGMTAIHHRFTHSPLLAHLKDEKARVLILGLGGGLNPQLHRSDHVLYQGCSNISKQNYQPCDRPLTAWLHTQFPQAQLIQGLTSDRVICHAPEKATLYRQTALDVVDMEGLALLTHLNTAGIATAMLRVISDDAHQSLPDLNAAIAPDGQLRPLSLAWQFIQSPRAAAQLIQGSLMGLRELTAIARQLGAYLGKDAAGLKLS